MSTLPTLGFDTFPRFKQAFILKCSQSEKVKEYLELQVTPNNPGDLELALSGSAPDSPERRTLYAKFQFEARVWSEFYEHKISMLTELIAG
jgi:hypothetical protein